MKFPTLNPFRIRSCLMLALALSFPPGTLFSEEPEEEFNELTMAALEHRTRLNYDGEIFSGPGLEKLLAGASGSQFFLIGEEHGIAENAELAAQLFTALVPAGYEKLAIEISPPMAALLDRAIKSGGLDGLRELYATPGGKPAFFGMTEEAELLVAARAALNDADQVFWGVDYEVLGDGALLRQLRSQNPPENVEAPLDALIAAANSAWTRFKKSQNPENLFMFSGDPATVKAVVDAWPDANAQSMSILRALQSTLEINQLWVQGRGWESNERRAALLKSNFLDHWNAARRSGETPKVMVKLGSNHIIRGRNMTATFDLGTLLPEIAAMDGKRTFSVLVLPGAGSLTAVLDPTILSYVPKPAKDNYADGLDMLTAAAFEDGFTLIDLAALRPVVGSSVKKYGLAAARVVHGFDMMLVMSGSTPASNLEHD